MEAALVDRLQVAEEELKTTQQDLEAMKRDVESKAKQLEDRDTKLAKRDKTSLKLEVSEHLHCCVFSCLSVDEIAIHAAPGLCLPTPFGRGFLPTVCFLTYVRVAPAGWKMKR